MRYVAKVRDDSPWNPITACAGATFKREEWLFVPLGLEEEAKANPYLVVKEYAEDEEKEPIKETPSEDPPIQILDGDEDFEDEGEGEPVFDVSDAALAYADENDIDLTEVEGSGKDGRILLKDVKTESE